LAFLDHNGESEFPMSKDKVFEAMQKAIPTISGLKIESADKLLGRFVVKAGVSLHSWGENIPIQLSEISENRTKVQITSSPKTGIMFGGAFDMGKNRKNIENILSSTSRILSSESVPNTSELNQTNNNQQTNSQSNNFQTNQNSNYMDNSNAWYEKTWLVVILCIIFFPVGLYALWKNSSISKGWKIGVTVFFALLVLANLGDKEDSNKEDSQNKTSNTEINDVENISKQLDNELKAFEKPFNRGNIGYKGMITMFRGYSEIISKAKSTNNKEMISKADDLYNKALKIQQKELPKMRKEFCDDIGAKLWEENISVVCKGSNNTTIELVSGIYANNKNIKKSQESISETLNLLKFKRVNYKWIKHDEEYTYYDLENDNQKLIE
jgi:hypothetical protein